MGEADKKDRGKNMLLTLLWSCKYSIVWPVEAGKNGRIYFSLRSRKEWNSDFAWVRHTS